MKKTLMLLVAAICLSCPGQWVITNYVYTVSNITIVTQNEITQNVNRAYNYYSTNFTINVETNLYIDTLIGTNIATNVENWVYNDYSTNFVENIITNTYIDTMIGTNIATNVTIYETNVNTYIDTWQNVYQTNYTTEVTLTNFEGYVEQCETIISNGVDYISSLTNNVGDAMLYAYICNETAQRLASTNAIVFATNSIPLADYQGYKDRLFQLACNDLNGSFMAKSAGTAGYNIYATSIYAVKMGSRVVHMYLSHVTQNEYGFEVCYLPRDNSLFISGTSYYIPGRMTWRYSCSSNILDVYEFNTYGTFIKKHQCRSFSALYPTAYGMSVSDSVSSTSGWTQMSPSLSIGGFLRPFYFKTSSDNPHYTSIFAPMFPSLDTWKYMWWLTNITGEHIR